MLRLHVLQRRIVHQSPGHSRIRRWRDDVDLDGLSMRQTLLDLQSRLGIMTPNPELEKEFTELRECAERYRELEKKFLEQKAVWATLKNQDT